MNEVIIKTDSLVKQYGTGGAGTRALKGISLEIPRGVFCCIVGPSGCGKSTLLHLLGALDKPTSGHVFIDGADTATLGNSELAGLRARKIGFVFQFFNLLPNLSAAENVETALLFAGNSVKDQRARSLELLHIVGLDGKLRSKPGELSGGEQQRVAIARALANDPPLLLMDEPTGNLDSVAEAGVLEQIFRLHRQGKTLVMVTHNARIAAQAEVLFAMKDGLLTTDTNLC